MRFFWVLVLGLAWTAAALAAVPAVRSRTSLGERCEEWAVDSGALGQREVFTVIYPRHYRAQGKPCPVVYLLHGAGRGNRTLIEDAGTRQLLREAPFVTVMPNGRNRWWIDSRSTPASAGQRWVREVIAVSEANLNVRADRAGRGLAGWSMGGFGAFRYAVDHPGEFAVLTTMIGLLDWPNGRYVPKDNYGVPKGLFGPAPAGQEAFNPLPLAGRLAGMAVLHTSSPTAFDRAMNEAFDRRLTALKIQHRTVSHPGGHTFGVVRASVADVVRFQAAHLAGVRPVDEKPDRK